MTGRKKKRLAIRRDTVGTAGDPVAAETPTTFAAALLHLAWRLPRWARYSFLVIAAVAAALFALWATFPERAREKAIEALLNRPRNSKTMSLEEARRRGLPVLVDGSLTVAEMKSLYAEMRTTAGTIRIDFFPEVAPNHVRNFVGLAAHRFYDGTRFHRVHPLFLIQGGDPNTRFADRSRWGLGGSSTTLKAEFSALRHERGTVSMARRPEDPDSATSQFFICVEPKPELNGTQTIFGRVVKGMDVVDEIAAGARNPRSDQPYHPVVIEEVVVRRRSDDSEWHPHGAKRGPISR